ncbi:MAG: competence ComEA-like helix-hairpin-helix protein [Bradymonadia bacterium]|jgi:competence ComEA-like helix-hairpin-helix protein
MRYGLILLCALFLTGVAGAVPAGTCPDGRIDVNTADAAVLISLKGIGQKKAAKIIADRSTNGPFANIGALVRVKGVGKKSVAKWAVRITTDCSSKASAIVPAAAIKGAAAVPGAQINLNTATVAELSTIKGIGQKTAAAIIALRDQKTGFKSVDELTEVKGIGKAKLAKIRLRLSIK